MLEFGVECLHRYVYTYFFKVADISGIQMKEIHTHINNYSGHYRLTLINKNKLQDNGSFQNKDMIFTTVLHRSFTFGVITKQDLPDPHITRYFSFCVFFTSMILYSIPNYNLLGAVRSILQFTFFFDRCTTSSRDALDKIFTTIELCISISTSR